MENLVMTAKVGGTSNKLDTVQLLPAGMHICRLYGIVDLGSQLNSYYGKYNDKIRLFFEFPGLRQQFYKDGEISPTVINREFTRSMSKKGHYRPFVEKAIGRKFKDDVEAENFNAFSLIDLYYVAVVSHSAPNDKGDVYENIDMISPYDERFAQGVDLTPFNDVMAYYIPAHGFESAAFANLYSYLRDKIRNSEEGVEHSQKGGKFAEPDTSERSSGGGSGHVQGPPSQPNVGQPAQTTGQPMQPQQAVNQPQLNQPNVAQARPQQPQAPVQQAPPQNKLVMVATDFSYDQYLASGWTDATLIEHGKAKIQSAAPAQPQQPMQPKVNVIAPQSLNNLQPSGDDSDLPL